MMRKTKTQGKKWTRIVAAVSALALLSGCGSNESVNVTSSLKASTADETEKEELHYTLDIAKASDAALHNPMIQLAQEKGYFEDYNLTVNISPLDLNGELEALSFGKIDALYNRVIPNLSYGAQGANITLFAGTLSGGMIAVARKENIEELSDVKNWKGKKLGIIATSIPEFVTRFVLSNEYGFTFSDDGEENGDITYKRIDSYANIVLAVEKGNVDIGFVSREHIQNTESLQCLTPLADLYPNYVCCRQTANSESLANNRDAYRVYLKAQIKAYKDLNTDKDGTVEILSKSTGEDEDYVRTYLYDVEANAKRSYNPDPNFNGVLDYYDTLLKWNYVQPGVELDQFFDISVYSDALQELIQENPEDSFYKDMWTFFLEHNNRYPDFETKYEAL